MTTSQIRYGLQLPESERHVPWSEYRQLASLAESVGFDSLWVGDHLLLRARERSVGPWEAWSILAALAEVTQKVLLGPLVACSSFHSPGVIAKKAVTIDEISGGRFVLGLGAGWHKPEYDAFGFAYDHRASRFIEAFTIIRTLIREGRIDFQGTYYTHRDLELLPRPRSDMQIMVGSNGPRIWKATLPHIDMWNAWYSWFNNQARDLKHLIGQLDEACAVVGRDPQSLTRSAAVHIQLSHGAGRISFYPSSEEAKPLTGSRERLADELLRLSSAGIDHFQIIVDPIDPRSIEELGEVIRMIR